MGSRRWKQDLRAPVVALGCGSLSGSDLAPGCCASLRWPSPQGAHGCCSLTTPITSRRSRKTVHWLSLGHWEAGTSWLVAGSRGRGRTALTEQVWVVCSPWEHGRFPCDWGCSSVSLSILIPPFPSLTSFQPLSSLFQKQLQAQKEKSFGYPITKRHKTRGRGIRAV